MNQRMTNMILIIIGSAFIVLSMSAFIVTETQTGIVTQFGKITRKNLDPGLHFKIPVIAKVETFDSRLQTFNADPETVLTSEKKYLVVDYFVEWRIGDSGQYYIRTGGNLSRAENIIDQIVSRIVRDEIARRDVQQVVAEDRLKIRKDITDKLSTEVESEGINVVDVRIKRVEFAEAIKDSVYERMRSERIQISNKFRAEGREDAAKIIAETDKQTEVILANARRDAAIALGKGEAAAISIQAEAFSQDFSFYRFQKALEAYEQAFDSGNDTFITQPNSEFFDFFRSSDEALATPAP